MNRRILDDLGSPIFTIHYSKERYAYCFKTPGLVYDIIDERKNEKNPVLKKVGISNLEKYGYAVIKIPLSKNERWGSNKLRFRLELIKLTNPLVSNFKKLNSDDSDVKIVVDEANLKIKMISNKINRRGETEWLDI